jgi:cytochrome c oxidase assembly protein subunit 15
MNEKINKSLRVWLKSGLFFVGVMLLLGGATRLTGSGLSMVTWDLLWGVFPPLSQDSWEIFFQAYKQSPEYLKVNFFMDLDGFKKIFWLEYLHRLMGRFLGLYFFIPLLVKNFPRRLMTGFLLVCFQGFWGWLMVYSGLKSVPYVDPFFLSGHLILAALLVVWILWEHEGHPHVHWKGLLYMGVILVEIFLGGLVAGFKAGYIYNTFPLMEGKWFPHEVMELKDLFFTPEGVQWLHRFWAVVTLGVIGNFCYIYKNMWVFLCLGIQIFLGIGALLFKVPLFLGVLHQFNAFVLLGFVSFFIFLKKS